MWQTELQKAFEDAEDKRAFIEEARDILHALSACKTQPIDRVRWVPVEKVFANDYNPNSVATNEMRLLHTSISHDGYTQPVVTIYDAEADRYVIVDGFHRYTIMRRYSDIRETTGGMLPIVVISKSIAERMASTVRHNRARGKHSVAGMANIVFGMLDNGVSDSEICKALGLESEELVRLKHVTGFSKLFENVDYKLAWETKRMLQLRKEYEASKAQASAD
jgi:ParB-like chromosome segregation protein Spo0J